MAVIHERGMNDKENELKTYSERLLRTIDTYKSNSSTNMTVLIERYIKFTELYATDQADDINRQIKDLDSIKKSYPDIYKKELEKLIKLKKRITVDTTSTKQLYDNLKDIHKIIDVYYDVYSQIATDTDKDAWKSNKELLDSLDYSSSLLALFNTFQTGIKHLELTKHISSKEISRIIKKLTSIKIKTQLEYIHKLVSNYVDEKKKNASVVSKLKDKFSPSNLKQKIGILPNTSKKKMLGRVLGVGVGAAGIFAASMFKSSGIAVATGAFVLSRQKKIEKEKEQYKKSITNINNFKQKIKDDIKLFKQKQDLEKLKRKIIPTSLAGGGKLKAKKDTKVLVGDNPGGIENIAMTTPSGMMRGMTSGPTMLGVNKGNSLSVNPISGIGKSSVDHSAFTKLGGGTGEDDSTSIEEKQLAVLEKIQRDNELYYADHISRLNDEANKAKGIKETRFPDKTPAQNVEAKVKDKGLLGAMGDILKAGITTALTTIAMNKMFGGAQNMTAGNIARLGGRTALTGGGAVVGGGIGYKAGGYLSEKMGLEEGGTGEKIMKAGGAVTGAVAGGLAGTKIGKMLPFLKNKEMGNDVQKVQVMNADEIGGSSVGDIGSKKGLWNTTKNVASKGKALGVSGLSSLGTLSGGGAMMGAAYGLHGTYKAITTGKSQQNDIARKVGLVKSKEDIESGKDTRSNWNPLKWAGAGIDTIASGTAKATNFITGQRTTKLGEGQSPEKVKKLQRIQELQKQGLSGKDLQSTLSKEFPNKNTKSQIVTQKPTAISSASTVPDIAKNINSVFDKQNKTEDELKKQKEELLKKEEEGKTDFWDKLTSSDNPFIKGIGNVVSTARTAVSAGMSGFRQAREKGGSFLGSLGAGVGAVAARFEGGKGGAGTISSGAGDFGGKSYGTYQLSSKQGSVDPFLKKSGYAAQFKGLQVGTPEFDAKWKEIARTDPKFAEAQQTHAKEKYATPQLAKLQKMGVDTSNRAIQEMAMSTGVQYGEDTDVLSAALKGKDASKMSPTDIINVVQDYKASSVGTRFKSSSGNVQAGVANRHGGAEREALLSLVNQTVDSTGKVVPQTAKTQAQMQAEFIAKEGKTLPTQTASNDKPKLRKKIGTIPKAPAPQDIQTASAIKGNPVPVSEINTRNSKIEDAKIEIAQAKLTQDQTSKTQPINNTTVVNNTSSSSGGGSGGGSVSVTSGDSSWVTMLVKGYGV